MSDPEGPSEGSARRPSDGPESSKTPPPEHESDASSRQAPDTTTAPEAAESGEDGEDDAPAPPAREPYDDRGLERPRFLLDFPHDPELDRLIAAFEAGNYAYVRENAERVAGSATDAAVRDAARELRRRIDPDPLARNLLAMSIALLVFLVLWAYLSHDS